ncbi:MAG: class I SAM-dependent methyltransferase [Bacteroidota bacterium]
MKAKYDHIGIDYAQQRKSDPRIAAQIHRHLRGAERILNIGAGTGSYEPLEANLVALEPSQAMIDQRPKGAYPVVKGTAEVLPFANNSFSHALTILSMHHWQQRELAFHEINRVVAQGFVAVTWNPESAPFWLTRDYFPEIIEWDRKIFPSLAEFDRYFDQVSVEPLLIPEDCIDGFLAAYWKRPAAYLEPSIRRSISSFSKLENIDQGLDRLAADIQSRKWHETNQHLLSQTVLDAGYVIVSAQVKPK